MHWDGESHGVAKFGSKRLHPSQGTLFKEEHNISSSSSSLTLWRIYVTLARQGQLKNQSSDVTCRWRSYHSDLKSTFWIWRYTVKYIQGRTTSLYIYKRSRAQIIEIKLYSQTATYLVHVDTEDWLQIERLAKRSSSSSSWDVVLCKAKGKWVKRTEQCKHI
jgi:hypothetical protein